MEINKLVFGGLIAGCLAAAGGGAYLATRHNAQETQGAVQASPAPQPRRKCPLRPAGDRLRGRAHTRTDPRRPGTRPGRGSGSAPGTGGRDPAPSRPGPGPGTPSGGPAPRQASARPAPPIDPAPAPAADGGVQRRVDVGGAAGRAGRSP